MPQVDELNDKEIMDRLDESYQAHLLKTDAKWIIIQKWLRRERGRAQGQLSTIDPDKRTQVAKLQEVIRLCNILAERIFIGIEKEGELALLEAKERGLVPDTVPDSNEEETTPSA